nr:ribonuclease H-like domain, reverse transcriptase, RNA-dependent DNA polymerase [Tanacetum cinerariifolium]GEY91683.1 ribonuclease H-like domain, reverse transcriptase, RNA-dependent DNA polymerase [Tanacetum cinerariifolium]
MARMVKEKGGLNQINDEDFHICMFVYFLSQEEPKRVHQALKDPSWIEAMQEELLQFKMQKVWVPVDVPKDGKLASTPIDTKKLLLNDPDGEDVDVHMYRSMISSLIYLTSSRPNIMFDVCYQVDETDGVEVTVVRHIITAISYTLMLFGLTKDVVHLMLLDDADGVECLPNEEIFAELARMGYEKPPPKLTFYKAFFLAKWKFLIHMIVQCMSAKRTTWNEFSSSMASTVICLTTVMINAQIDDISSHNTKYTSPSLTHKVFANMRRIGKGFSRVETPLFDTMLVQPQVPNVAEVEEDEDHNEVSAAPTLPSPTLATTPPPPQQEPIPSPS